VLTDTVLADLRTSLEEEQGNLRARLAELSDGQDGSLAFDQNFADTSQVTAERGEVDVLVGTLKETLVQVEDALRKLDQGTYGACERCGEAIAPARLEAKPEARRCINCASLR
jgi:RNA polymerase-binding transcription factor DksA